MKKKFVVMLSALMLMAVPVCSFASVANNEITSAKIKDGEVKTADIANLAVTTAKIADGAVTAAKLAACSANQMLLFNGTAWVCSAPVAGAKGDTGATGPQGIQGPKGDTGATGPQGPAANYAKVAVVAQSGGSYTDPISAMDNLATWCGTPSATNPCLVKIMPGVYNLNSATVNMSSYVDIEGSGANVTKISGSANGVVSASSVTNAEIRD